MFEQKWIAFVIFMSCGCIGSLTGCSGSDERESQQTQESRDSIGTLDDPQIYFVPEGASRFYYVGDDQESSVQTNAMGDAQVLYYDVYAPTQPAQSYARTVLFLHGGGYQGGYANDEKVVAQCRYFASLNQWCVSIEYRRGWLTQTGAISTLDLNNEDDQTLRQALEMAKTDVLHAWDHLSTTAAPQLDMPTEYLVVGTSAGGSIASRITLTHPELTHEVDGVIIGFGTHPVDEPVLSSRADIPVVLQGGMVDIVSPFYTNHAWFDPDVVMAKGMMNLYEELQSKNFHARFYLSAQQGHGFGFYGSPSFLPKHYGEALLYFAQVATGTAPDNYIEFGFALSDPTVPVEAGERINTLDQPNFRYEPYQTSLEEGALPSSIDF
jgi:pimeloyl-ACP methyl ester carboxylesterase